MSVDRQKEIRILSDTIHGEINRMCVSEDLDEVKTMMLNAIKNVCDLVTERCVEMCLEKYAK